MRRDPTGPGLIISATGTAAGKTTLARGLARAMSRAGLRVAALKPFETGARVNPEDAVALARACDRPELAHVPGLYRATAPLAPFAVELTGGRPCDPAAVADAVRSAASGSDVVLIEGAGGLGVPLTKTVTFADFAAALGWPLILVGRNELGILSHMITALELASSRKLDIELIALGASNEPPDESAQSNPRTLREVVAVKVETFRVLSGSDDALADAAMPILERLSLSGLLLSIVSPTKDDNH